MADGKSRDRSAPRAGDVLLVVDLQNDFRPGGALAVPGGDEIVPAVNRLAASFPHTRAGLAALPDRLRGLEPVPPYEVRIGEALTALARACDRRGA